MKIRSLLLGAIASSIGLGSWAGAADYWAIPDAVITGGGGIAPRHRSSGSRAHRAWRKRRSSGRV